MTPVTPMPPAASIRRRNPRRQGEIGLGAAIAWFCANGWTVSVPLCDNQPYDLVVDDGGGLAKVQVKTTTRLTSAGNFQVQLETAGGNQSFSTRKPFDNTAVDYLFILTDARVQYLIPAAAVVTKRAITMCGKYERFRVH
jgi:hypothetical protein